jgi:hypothetical protein
MDDFGRDIADETTEVVSETTVSASAELRKRRSTRIVQAVPVVVTGVDALGRPFSERTSSLIVNCHGCRYQSKHYVLKNMWVTLDVPHPEADHPPRSVRGRVAWIQRPRTVRQLFQVALELEVPGNVWGIGFPPEDWFTFPEGGPEHGASEQSNRHQRHQESLGAQGQSHSNAPASQAEGDFKLPLADAELASASASDNVRVFPSPASTTDASLQLARQVARLLIDAKQQIHAEVREAAAQAVSAERRIDAAQWEQKIAAAREELSREVADALKRIQEETDARRHAAHQAAGEALQADLPRWLAPQLEELTRNLTAQLSQEGLAQRSEHARQLTQAVDSVRAISEQAEQTAARVRERTEASEAQLAALAEQAVHSIHDAARQTVESLAAEQESSRAAATALQNEIVSTQESAKAAWGIHLVGELQAAQMRWQIAIDNALAVAHEGAAASLSEHANTLVSQMKEQADHLAAAFQQSTAALNKESGQQLSGLQESMRVQLERMESALARAGQTSERLENFSERLNMEQQQALGAFQSQLDDVLSVHRNELHRRSEALCEEINARIHGTFEESTREALANFGQQIESIIRPEVTKADEAIHRLAGGRSLLDAALTLQQDRIRSSADESFAEALAQFRGNLGSVEQLLRESAETLTARSLSELESKVENVKHQTVEDLLKTGEWYEKKAQTQIQGFAEKATEQAGALLHEKAGEVAAVFTSELDNSSRSFVSHTQTQMEDVVNDSFERARSLFGEAAETTSAAFIDEIQRHARQELGGFEEELQKSATETRVQINAMHSDLAQRLTIEQEDFLRRFQKEMTGAVQAGVAEAHQRVEEDFTPLLDAWKSMIEAHQKEMREIYGHIAEQAAEHYRGRLENVSNQWMLATVTSLDHQSRDVITGIAAAAEEKLRDTCTNVFAGIGEALRDRLQQIAANFNVPMPPPAH